MGGGPAFFMVSSVPNSPKLAGLIASSGLIKLSALAPTEADMSRQSMLLACVCVAAGALLGYAAASGKLNLFPSANGAGPAGVERQPDQFVAAKADEVKKD